MSDEALVEVIKTAVLKGCLSTYSNEEVTFVNATSKAAEMGLPVTANVNSTVMFGSAFTNKLAVEFTFADDVRETIEGTVLSGAGMRITKIGDLALDCPPGAHMLIFENRDQPGVLHKVCV